MARQIKRFSVKKHGVFLCACWKKNRRDAAGARVSRVGKICVRLRMRRPGELLVFFFPSSHLLFATFMNPRVGANVDLAAAAASVKLESPALSPSPISTSSHPIILQLCSPSFTDGLFFLSFFFCQCARSRQGGLTHRLRSLLLRSRHSRKQILTDFLFSHIGTIQRTGHTYRTCDIDICKSNSASLQLPWER